MSELPASLQRHPELDAWVRIEPDGGVTLFTGKVEIGQGLRTAIARIGAEELDVSPERVSVVMADTDRTPNELFTAGSNSIQESGAAVRQAAAEARQALVEMAAERLGIHVQHLDVEDGVVVHPESGRSLSYAELSGGKPFARAITGDTQPKLPARYTLIGRPARRVDLAAKVTGGAFVHDLELDDMLHARVVRPPQPGARLLSLDESRARDVPGVVAVVRDGSFVGVLAEREEQAVLAADRLRADATWSEPPRLPRPDTLYERLREGATQSLPVVDGTPRPDPVPPLKEPSGATTTLRATYTRPYHMHASLGPSAALAWLREGVLTIWTASQGVYPLRASIARVLGMEPEHIRVIHAEGAGCYGHNGADDAAMDAALLARASSGRPVRLQWSREDEHVWEPYGPAMRMDMQGSLDAEGRVIGWSHEVWSNSHMGRALPFRDRSNLLASWHLATPWERPRPRPLLAPHGGIHRNADPLYAFPDKRVVKHLVADAPLRTSSMRGLGAYANVFAIESFVDELAAAAGADPVEFRLRHLDDARARAVIEAAAERARWNGGDLGEGRGRGVGFAQYKNEKCYAAVVIELAVDLESAAIRLERAVIGADAGQVIDPDGLCNQLEGGALQAASWTLIERVRFDEDGIRSVDWDTYPILTFPDAPAVETVLIDRPELPPLGAGEATQGPTGAAIANAIFDATGLRLRALPLTPERLREAAGS